MTQISKLMKTSLIVAMSLFLINCGGSSDEEKLVKEHNSLAQEINAMGTPDTDWSEAEIESYIAKLDRLDILVYEADSDPAIIGSFGNASVISNKRDNAYRVLSEKRSLLDYRKKSEKLQTMLTEFATEYDNTLKELQTIDPTSKVELNSYIVKIEKSKSNSKQIKELLNNISRLQNTDLKDKTLSLLKNADDQLSEIEEAIKIQLNELSKETSEAEVNTEKKSIELLLASLAKSSIELGPSYEKIDSMNREELVALYNETVKLQGDVDILENMISSDDGISQSKKDNLLTLLDGAKKQFEIAEQDLTAKMSSLEINTVEVDSPIKIEGLEEAAE